MSSVVNITLNIAAGVMVAIMLATSVREDLVRFFALGYAVFFVLSLIIQDGGQVNVAIALGLFAHAFLSWISKDNDNPNSLIKQRETVKVFTGIMTAQAQVGTAYNTYDPTSSTYKRLPRSINRMGGAQFSYSFWLMFEQSINDDDVRNKTLFMRGDSHHYSPMVSQSDNKDLPVDKYFEKGSDYTIACPRVSFLTANKMAIDINTDRELRHRFVVGSSDPSLALRKNALSLIPGHFVLFTVVLEDNVGIDSFEKGVRCKVYINDQLYHTGTTSGSLRENNGPLHLFLDETPEGTTSIPHCKMADLTYYNFALEDKDVASVYSQGFNDSNYMEYSTVYNKDKKLKMSAYNKLDIAANYDDRLFFNQIGN
ncbi:putative concanavalin A-like lectin/glucanase domain-containing protein [Tetraselmis virus 1]|uniref:Putative concanavalin A-like lectin/glucanase domain-containing protein n=1 Tax=Tetraselmis virus 1 TaxID=2060617 RepID=A0A2P0VMQ8_9VIRU|nr:putative concanavalin A-like lectin/glucanase domain-containing protein [Tetraselmis virus 1]AUF82176.1 putative concanavalin A-like lectin/glucanase domain-containing protein [Tetraselmis virus 1]